MLFDNLPPETAISIVEPKVIQDSYRVFFPTDLGVVELFMHSYSGELLGRRYQQSGWEAQVASFHRMTISSSFYMAPYISLALLVVILLGVVSWAGKKFMGERTSSTSAISVRAMRAHIIPALASALFVVYLAASGVLLWLDFDWLWLTWHIAEGSLVLRFFWIISSCFMLRAIWHGLSAVWRRKYE